MKLDTVEADVLCVGGGIAGLMAAIRASETGARVVVADKGNTLYSGSGGSGCDHFECYIPEIHGSDIRPLIDEFYRSGVSGIVTRHMGLGHVRTWLEQSFEIVKLWDSWGIPMKYKGKYEFAGHAFPGHPMTHLKYSGQNQKRILTEVAHKRGVEIMNRVMIFDLLANNTVVGAIGISTREDKLTEFRAKSVVLATGGCMRLYPSPTPGWIFNIASSPECTGDGRAMAYRAGTELVSMEIPVRWAGPKYFCRSGKATWVGVLRDPQGKPVGPFVTKPDKRYGDVAADVYTTMFEDYTKSGRGPVYMDCRGISDEDFDYMMYWLKQEGNTALINHLEDEGVDLRRNPVEFMTYEIRTAGSVYHNERGATAVKGLYAAGAEFFNAVSGAATFGWIAGESAAKYAREARSPEINVGKIKSSIEGKRGLLDEIRSREVGANWKEVNLALQQIMHDYAGSIRSETLLQVGLSHLRRLKEKAYTTIMAKNQHELMRCLEVLDLLDLGELVFIAANERKETRGRHVRPDYPFTNPLLENLLIVKKIDGKPVTEWREIQR